MKVLLDTSVLVAAMVEVHPAHERALPWLQRAKRHEVSAFVASHTLAELYAVLTRLPVKPPISPNTAWQLIQENVCSSCEMISLAGDDYRGFLEDLSNKGIIGGATYDALIAYSASKAKVDHLVTLNGQDFRRVYTDHSEKLVVA